MPVLVAHFHGAVKKRPSLRLCRKAKVLSAGRVPWLFASSDLCCVFASLDDGRQVSGVNEPSPTEEDGRHAPGAYVFAQGMPG